jgi:hypothetical protein
VEVPKELDGWQHDGACGLSRNKYLTPTRPLSKFASLKSRLSVRSEHINKSFPMSLAHGPDLVLQVHTRVPMHQGGRYK